MEKLVLLGTPHQLSETDPLFPRLASVTPEAWRTKFPESVAAYEKLNPADDFDALVRASVSMWIDLTDQGYPGSKVRSVSCPVLVVRGDEDPLVARADTFTLVSELPRASLLNVPFASHEAHKEQHAIIGPLIERFLSAR